MDVLDVGNLIILFLPPNKDHFTSNIQIHYGQPLHLPLSQSTYPPSLPLLVTFSSSSPLACIQKVPYHRLMILSFYCGQNLGAAHLNDFGRSQSNPIIRPHLTTQMQTKQGQKSAALHLTQIFCKEQRGKDWLDLSDLVFISLAPNKHLIIT